MTVLSEIQAELHRTGLGGSDGAAILGCHPKRSALDVYLVKKGLKPPFDNRFTNWGNKLESVVAEAYAEETGRQVFEPLDAPFAAGLIGEHGLLRHPKYPYIMGFPDRLVFDTTKGPGVLECKNTSAWLAKDWEEDVPLQHQVQTQHYLMLTGFKWGSIAALIGGNDARFMDMDEAPSFQETYVQALVRFYEDHLLPGIPPDVDPEKDAENLRYAFQAVAGVVADLPPNFEAIAERFEDLKAQVKGLEEEKERLATAIKAAIGNAEAGRLPSGWGYTFKESERKGYTVAPTTVRTLRRVKAL